MTLPIRVEGDGKRRLGNLRHSCRPRAVLFAYVCTLCTYWFSGQECQVSPEWNLNATTTAGVLQTNKKSSGLGNHRNAQRHSQVSNRLRIGTGACGNARFSADPKGSVVPREYTIGPEDVLDINVFEAQEMNRRSTCFRERRNLSAIARRGSCSGLDTPGSWKRRSKSCSTKST